ncbi:unnamed protein product [Pseudo-nitzschia multistriata]|uniref:Uncharacterized protein n=1 Tax=Pseudo-nitzschia multistriata TaxID=183589 RepID=A0A448ZB79_9STRA|nr:unnamed protein product [Pseudo-nitzschia multistriata]
MSIATMVYKAHDDDLTSLSTSAPITLNVSSDFVSTKDSSICPTMPSARNCSISNADFPCEHSRWTTKNFLVERINFVVVSSYSKQAKSSPFLKSLKSPSKLFTTPEA